MGFFLALLPLARLMELYRDHFWSLASLFCQREESAWRPRERSKGIIDFSPVDSSITLLFGISKRHAEWQLMMMTLPLSRRRGLSAAASAAAHSLRCSFSLFCAHSVRDRKVRIHTNIKYFKWATWRRFVRKVIPTPRCVIVGDTTEKYQTFFPFVK